MISFVYFDIGGVLVKDFSKTNKWEEMVKEFNLPTTYDFDKYESELNHGRSMESVVEETGVNLTVEDFVNRFSKNLGIWSLVEEIKMKNRVGLLTNMYPGMRGIIENHGLLPEIDWDSVVDSSLEGVAKPDEAIYVIAEERAGVPAPEIFYVENTARNLEVAKARGWQTFFYDSGKYEEENERLRKTLIELGL